MFTLVPKLRLGMQSGKLCLPGGGWHREAELPNLGSQAELGNQNNQDISTDSNPS